VASTSIDNSFSYLGFFGGLVLAVFIGYLIVVQGRKIQLRKFFSITSLLLVVFAAGMIAHGTHEFHEYLEYQEHSSAAELGMAEAEEEEGAVYSIFESKTEADNPSTFWYRKSGENYNHILNDQGSIGSFFKGLFGYNSDPIWPEFILWWIAIIFGFVVWRRMYK
jgi:high-affinity iron transporter